MSGLCNVASRPQYFFDEYLSEDQVRILDAYASLAALLTNTPLGFVNVLNSDGTFAAERAISAQEKDNKTVICKETISNLDQINIIENLDEHEVYKNAALVRGEPYLRAYAGMPLVTAEGVAVGVLCVVDQKPRQFSSEQIMYLRGIGRHVVYYIDIWMARRRESIN